jgi:hypothetical protein
MFREGLENKNVPDNDKDHGKHQYLGQTYLYHKNVMGPDHLGMSPEGSMDSLIKNVAGLINYGEVLITGSGHANAKVNREGRDEALGDKFFMKTMGTCNPIKIDENSKPYTAIYKEKKIQGTPNKTSCEERRGNNEYDEDNEETCDYIYYKQPESVPEVEGEKVSNTQTKYSEGDELKNLKDEKKDIQKRYVYIDNLPTGTIPGLGELKGFRGLIPGMIENLSAFNPMGLINAVTAPSVPPCIKLNMETIQFKDDGENSSDWYHKYGTDAHYVALTDIADLNPCSFELTASKGTNPITGREKDDCPEHASETFENLFKNTNDKQNFFKLKNKPIAKLFNMSFGLLMVYLLWKVLKKES